MIAAPVQRDVDRVPKGSHLSRVPPAGSVDVIKGHPSEAQVKRHLLLVRSEAVGTIEYRAHPARSLPQHTVRIAAGAVDLGVEFRDLDDASVRAEFGPDAEARFNGGQRPAGMGAVLEEHGVSLHVWRTDTGDEVFRADCFAEAPHVHFLTPGDPPRNVVVEHDPAEGPLLEWTISHLADDLGGLLRRSGADDVADALDAGRVAEAVRTVAQVARYVEAAGRPVVVA